MACFSDGLIEFFNVLTLLSSTSYHYPIIVEDDSIFTAYSFYLLSFLSNAVYCSMLLS